MRRAEFEVTEPDAIAEVLNACDYGVMSIISGGEPYGVAVNFVYANGTVYFHGSREGRKAEAIGAGARVSFLAVQPYAYIPSYFSDTRSACPATQYFASVHIGGEARPVEAAAAKSEALNALMRKMQPEGGYEPIAPENPIYTKALEMTGVYAITVESATLKVKAGQNLPEAKHAALAGRLQARGGDADVRTLEAMEAFRS